MSETPPADSSQLWSNTTHDASVDAHVAAGEVEAARAAMAGGGDLVAQQQAADRLAFAQAQHGAALYQQGQHQAQQFVVERHNAPINQALRAQSEQQSSAALGAAVGLGLGLATVGATATTLGAMNDGPQAPTPEMPALSGPTGSFAETIGAPSAAAPLTFATSPTHLFNSRGWNATEAFGVAPTLGDMPSVGAYSQPELATAETSPDAAEPVAALRVQRPNAAMHLGMAMTPKPNAEFFERMGGGKS